MIRIGYSEDYIKRITPYTAPKEDSVYTDAIHNIEYIYNAINDNKKEGAYIYEIITDIFPHITNFSLIDSDEYSDLSYSISSFSEILLILGGFINKSDHTILFHPKYINLGTPDKGTSLSNKRVLYYNSILIDKMKLNDSYIIIQMGSVYNNKKETIKRLIQAVDELPIELKRRLVLENDCKNYSMKDIMLISRSVKNFTNSRHKFKIPILFNYDEYINFLEKDTKPISFNDIVSDLIRSWKGKSLKISLVQKRKEHMKIDELKKILPDCIKSIPNTYSVNIDIVIRSEIKNESFSGPEKRYSIS